MNRLVKTTFFYVVICTLILVIPLWTPYSLTGPGLDLVVYGVCAILTIASCTYSLIKTKSDDKISYLNLFINAGGLILVSILLYIELRS